MQRKVVIRMKKYLSFLLVCIVCGLFFTGCQSTNLKGNVEKPTWTESDENDYTSSMTAVVRVDLKAAYKEAADDWQLNEADLLAAFAGERCLDVESPVDGLFYLYIPGMEGDVTLRYYSTHYKNLFVAADAFTFKNDDRLGTVAEPLIPIFAVEK